MKHNVFFSRAELIDETESHRLANRTGCRAHDTPDLQKNEAKPDELHHDIAPARVAG